MSWINNVRSKINIVKRYIYFNNASSGPLFTDTVGYVKKFLDMWNEEGEPWDFALDCVIEVKKLFAEFVGASKDEIAAVPGATYGINIILSSIKYGHGCNAVISELNFPTSIYTLHALRKRGFIKEVRIARSTNGYIPLEEYEKLIDDKTSVVLVDYVTWITGYRERIKEIAEIAHRHGSIVITDAYQAVGAIPIDVRKENIDVLVTGSSKWLMGIHGAGFMYVNRDVLNELEPMFSGWLSIEDSILIKKERGEELLDKPLDIEQLKLSSTASRFEWGTWPLISFIGTKVSLNMLKKYDAPGKYNSHTSKIIEMLMNGIEELGLKVITPRESYAAIVSFEHKNPKELANYLKSRNVIVSSRPGVIRLSPHFYNTIEEAEKFLEILKQYIT